MLMKSNILGMHATSFTYFWVNSFCTYTVLHLKNIPFLEANQLIVYDYDLRGNISTPFLHFPNIPIITS